MFISPNIWPLLREPQALTSGGSTVWFVHTSFGVSPQALGSSPLPSFLLRRSNPSAMHISSTFKIRPECHHLSATSLALTRPPRPSIPYPDSCRGFLVGLSFNTGARETLLNPSNITPQLCLQPPDGPIFTQSEACNHFTSLPVRGSGH